MLQVLSFTPAALAAVFLFGSLLLKSTGKPKRKAVIV